jgi:hypothetical protein
LAFQVNHGDAAHGIGDPGAVALPGLAFVGGKEGIVAGKDYHVGLHAGFIGLHESQAAVGAAGKQRHSARLIVALRLDGGRQVFPTGRNCHTGHVAVSKAIDVDQRLHVDVHTGRRHVISVGEIIINTQ